MGGAVDCGELGPHLVLMGSVEKSCGANGEKGPGPPASQDCVRGIQPGVHPDGADGAASVVVEPSAVVRRGSPPQLCR